MAVLAKPINRLLLLNAEESKQFIREFNNKKVDQEFLKSCEKAGRLFKREK